MRRSNEMTDPKPPSERNEQQEQGDEQQEQEKWYERTRYQILLFAGGIALFVLLGGLILDWYIEPRTSGQKKDLVQALGLLTAGVAGAVGIYFTWRGQSQARRAQEENQRSTQEQLNLTRHSQEKNQQATQAQLQNAQEELQLTRQGQITERFTRAIDQLGNESLEIRLGGIYALERIARESEEDHWPIMEVLTAYVRQHAHWSPGEGQEGTEVAAEKNAKEDSNGESDGSGAPEVDSTGDPEIPGVPPLDPDIQAIMTVLRRRTRSLGHGEPEPLDLHETNLREAVLRKAILREANLQGANLQVADLSEANLQGADLSEANLQGTNLPWDLSGTNLKGANLREADLSEVRLPRDLSEVNLSEANLSGANLQEANLQGANLQGADLAEADLARANL
jgi:uncharacterized protein YjbI with pentapeptide repeats